MSRHPRGGVETVVAADAGVGWATANLGVGPRRAHTGIVPAVAASGVVRRGWQDGTTFTRHALRRSEPLPRRIRTALAVLGPPYVKVGQVIAASPGLFPAQWITEFASLRDREPPDPRADG